MHAQGNNPAALSNDQLQQLNQRFRCKADLFKYMDRVMQVYLPAEKNCSIQVRNPKIIVRARSHLDIVFSNLPFCVDPITCFAWL
jgi:hypothetical protein